MTTLPLGVLAACSGAESPPGAVGLDPVARTVRVSMALRGLRPDPAVLEQVRDRPDSLDDLVETWLHSDELGRTLVDMHGEQLLIRADVDEQLPPFGPLTGFDTSEIHAGLTDAPLRLIERVVQEGRPYTEIVTADWLMVSEPYAIVHGLPFDPGGPEWQEAQWDDGRPRAGILSDSELWRRHRSAGSNFHRGRANFVASKLLCEDFAVRDVPVEGGIDLSDELAVAHAVQTQTTCIGCHQALDPLAGFFWGFRHQLKARVVRTTYAESCRWPADIAGPLPDDGVPSDFCYPLRFYQPELEDDWIAWDLRPPGYYGLEGDTLTDLGARIAEDPRFATCTAKRFWSWFAQTPVDDVPDDLAMELREVLVDSGFDARELVRAIVLHPRFGTLEGAETPVGVLHARPEQLSSAVEDITGFRWEVLPDRSDCDDGECWGPVELSRSDRYGFRAMAGGVDGWSVLDPTHTSTPTRSLFLERFAADAASRVVQNDLALPVEERHLLTLVDADTTAEARVRDQLAWLHQRISSELVGPDSKRVDESYALWSAALAHSDNPARAWMIVVAALLQDDRMELY